MKTLKLIQTDSYLRPYASAIEGRYNYAIAQEKKLTGGQKLSDWANGHMFYGLHKLPQQWVIREWAPNATAIYLLGDCNGWQKNEAYRLQPIGEGVWEAMLDENMLQHEQLFKLLVEWQGGSGERIPSYARRVVQDPVTKLFAAQVWAPIEVKGERLKVKVPCGLFLLSSVVPGRFELPTSTLSVWRSNQLSYRTRFKPQGVCRV